MAYDPNGTGKDDHVACIGLIGQSAGNRDYTYTSKVWVFNARTSAQEGSAVRIGGTWEDDLYYDAAFASRLLSIAAGDMDGDGKDELYAYRPGTYTDISGNDTNKKSAIVKISGSSSSVYLNNLLYPGGGWAWPWAT